MKHLYPEADVPIVQISLDYKKSAQQHYETIKTLSPLRHEGILIVGSGCAGLYAAFVLLAAYGWNAVLWVSFAPLALALVALAFTLRKSAPLEVGPGSR